MSFQAYVIDETGAAEKPKSKKALREAVQADPRKVFFRDLSFFNNRGSVPVEEMTGSEVIAGPCAETRRNWYANIRNGKVV